MGREELTHKEENIVIDVACQVNSGSISGQKYIAHMPIVVVKNKPSLLTQN